MRDFSAGSRWLSINTATLRQQWTLPQIIEACIDDCWDGTHYRKTANAWLARMDANAEALQPILEKTYGIEHAEMWRNRWRIFFMSCAELFGFRNGQEWWVSHYLFERQA